MTDHVISNNLVVLGMSTFTGGQTFDGQMIVDLDNTEALLVRQDGDGGDVFVVDTVNSLVQLPGSAALTIGTNPAASGSIRLPNTGDIVWRNAGNSGDLVLLSVGTSDEMILGETTTGPFIRVVPPLRCFENFAVVHTSTVAVSISQDGFANNIFTIDTTNGEVDIGSTIVLPLASVDRLRLIGPNLTVNGTAGGSHSILLQGKTRTSGGVNHTSDWRILVTPLSSTGFDGASILRFNGAIDGAAGSEVLRMEDNGRVAFIQPEQFSIGSATFIDNVQVHITGSFIDDYGGGPTETHKLKITGSQTGDTGRTNRQTSVDVDTSIITQNLSQTINEVGAMFIDAPTLNIGTDTVNIGYTLKVNNYPTDGTENYGLLVDGFSATANLTALVRIGKSGLQTGIKLLVGGSVGFDDLDANAQMRLTGIYTSDGAATSAALLHVHTTLLPEDGTTDHITGAFFQGSLRTQVAVENVANISQVRIDEPNIQDNLTGTITQASTLLITGAPTEATRNYALNVEDGSVRFALAGPHVIGGVPQSLFQFAMVGSFTSGGSGIQAASLRVAPNLGGAPGDTLRLTGTDLASVIVTQTATESIADIAQLFVNEPVITNNLTGSITNAQTVLINGAPTEGVNNYALRIVGGDLQMAESAALLFRNEADDADIPVLSFADSNVLLLGSSAIPVIDINSRMDINDQVQIRHSSDVSNAFSVARFSTSEQMVLVDTSTPKLQFTSDTSQFRGLTSVVGSATTSIIQARAEADASSGSSITLAGLIPAGAFVLGVTTRIRTNVSGPAGFTVGDGVDVDRWGTSNGLGSGAVTDGTDFTSGSLTLFSAANDVVITSDGVDFTGGTIAVAVHYMFLEAPIN